MAHWQYKDFTDAVYKLTNINLEAYNERQMKRRIDSFIQRSQCRDYYDYYAAISSDREMLNKFINFITINVTEFFRNPPQWEKLRREIIPKLQELRQPVKIWSSACSTGEEPYSVIMLLNEFTGLSTVKILATDIDEGALEKARTGIYAENSLKSLPNGYLEKYFDREGDKYRIKDIVKKRVEFKRLDLLADPYPKECHLILCRNVMIYFTQDAKERMYRQFYNALLPGGFLFLGNTEQIINPERYGFVSMKSFFYTRN